MTTTVVYAGAADGQIKSLDGFDDYDAGYDGVYATARAGTGTSIAADTAATDAVVGQRAESPFGYFNEIAIWETFLGFDTSAIADTDTVSAATLNLTSSGDQSATDFTIEARLRDWGGTLTTADWVAGADLSGLTSLATYATSSGFVAGTAYDLTDVAMPANVNKTGTTYLLLCSSRTTGNNAPTGNEYVSIRSANYTGTTSDPKLTVTHAAGSNDITIDSGGGAFGWSPGGTASENFIATSAPAFGWTPSGSISEDFLASGGPVFGWTPAATLAETFATSGGAAFGWSPGGTLDTVPNAFDMSGGAAFGWAVQAYIAIPVVASDEGGVGRRGRRTPFDDWTLDMDDGAVLELYLLGKTR